jgi:hypothetical protein
MWHQQDSNGLLIYNATLLLYNAFDKTESSLHLLRFFQLSNDCFLAITGVDFDDHELWHLNGNDAELLGTATEETFKHLKRTRNLELTVNSTNFTWLNEELTEQWTDKVLIGKFTTDPKLKDRYNFIQTYLKK